MKQLARSRETDSFDWETEVTIEEDPRAPSLWRITVMLDVKTLVFPCLTRGQVRLFCDAMRRAITIASVKVNPLDDCADDQL